MQYSKLVEQSHKKFSFFVATKRWLSKVSLSLMITSKSLVDLDTDIGDSPIYKGGCGSRIFQDLLRLMV